MQQLTVEVIKKYAFCKAGWNSSIHLTSITLSSGVARTQGMAGPTWSYFIRKMPLLQLPLHLKRCHRHQMLPCFTHIEPTIKHRYGGVKASTHWVGYFLFIGRMMPVTTTEPLAPPNYSKSFVNLQNWV